VPEVIDEGVTGFIVEDMPTAIKAAERAVDLDRALVRQTFEERFSAQRMAEDYVKLYEILATSNPDSKPFAFKTEAA
jgi:glycosyltransferase involved in cell wall biosynthesis